MVHWHWFVKFINQLLIRNRVSENTQILPLSLQLKKHLAILQGLGLVQASTTKPKYEEKQKRESFSEVGQKQKTEGKKQYLQEMEKILYFDLCTFCTSFFYLYSMRSVKFCLILYYNFNFLTTWTYFYLWGIFRFRSITTYYNAWPALYLYLASSINIIVIVHS